MPGENETPTETKVEETKPAPQPVFDKKAADEHFNSRAAELKTALQKENEKAVQTALAEQKRSMAAAMGLVDNDEDREEQLAEVLVTKPGHVLKNVVALAVEQAEERVEKKWQERSQRATAQQQEAIEVNKVLDKRPDIRNDDVAFNVLDKIYASLDSTMKTSDRINEAIKQYDLWTEKVTGVSAKERIAKAASPNASDSTRPESPKGKTEQEVFKASIERTLEAARKKRGGLSTRPLR